jgi:DNA polymerase
MQTLTPVTIDFETYYDNEYSLRKIKTPLFVRDARFQVHGAGIKVGDLGTAYFRAGDELENALKNIPWANTRLVGHNLRFDALILSHHYGYTPAEYFDTRSLCAPILPSSVKKDLDSCAKALLNADAGKISGAQKGCAFSQKTYIKNWESIVSEMSTSLGNFTKNTIK